MSKQGKTLNSQSHEQVMKLYVYFERESVNGGPFFPMTQPIERVVETLGIGKRTVTQIHKDKYGPSGSEENLYTHRKEEKDKIVVSVDNFNVAAVCSHIYGYYSRKDYNWF